MPDARRGETFDHFRAALLLLGSATRRARFSKS